MSRVTPTPSTFTQGDYTLKNETLNFTDVFFIEKIIHRPIGTNLSLFAIRFENLDSKNHYWVYPDQGARDADYTILDAIEDFGAGGTSDPNAPTASNQVTTFNKLVDLENKLQTLIDQPDFEIISQIGFDSSNLDNEQFGTFGTFRFAGETGVVPTITPINSTSFSWESQNRQHWILAPIQFDFSNTVQVNIYFTFQNIGGDIGLNRQNFYLQYEQSPNVWITVATKFSNFVDPSNTAEIVHLFNDNSSLMAANYRLVIQERGTNDDSKFPSAYKVELLGVANGSTALISRYERLENNVPVSIEYKDALNQVYTLTGNFIADTSRPSTEKVQESLVAIRALLEANAKTDYERIIVASDYLQTISYLDQADQINRRPHIIVHASASLGLSITETLTYAGVAGDYYFLSKALSL